MSVNYSMHQQTVGYENCIALNTLKYSPHMWPREKGTKIFSRQADPRATNMVKKVPCRGQMQSLSRHVLLAVGGLRNTCPQNSVIAGTRDCFESFYCGYLVCFCMLGGVFSFSSKGTGP